jgi:hypothetical protein
VDIRQTNKNIVEIVKYAGNIFAMYFKREVIMTLTNEQEEEVRKRVIEMFGEDTVKKMDSYFMELNEIRIGSNNSFDFLKKVKEKYAKENSELIIAAILYGMRQGEIGYQYYLEQQAAALNTTEKPLPVFAHAE